MNLFTARQLMPIRTRADREQDRLTYLPKSLYETTEEKKRRER